VYASANIIRVIESRGDEMGASCSTHRRDEKCILNFGRKT
jgi:hypothetical protein